MYPLTELVPGEARDPHAEEVGAYSCNLDLFAERVSEHVLESGRHHRQSLGSRAGADRHLPSAPSLDSGQLQVVADCEAGDPEPARPASRSTRPAGRPRPTPARWLLRVVSPCRQFITDVQQRVRLLDQRGAAGGAPEQCTRLLRPMGPRHSPEPAPGLVWRANSGFRGGAATMALLRLTLDEWPSGQPRHA